MAREAKFNFVSEDLISKMPKNKGVEYTVSLIRQVIKKGDKEIINHKLYFSKDVVWIYELSGKRLKFYIDKEKKALGWRILEGTTTFEELNSGRLVNPMKSGQWIVSVNKLLNNSGIDIKETHKSLPVKKYSTPEYLQGNDLFYIQL